MSLRPARLARWPRGRPSPVDRLARPGDVRHPAFGEAPPSLPAGTAEARPQFASPACRPPGGAASLRRAARRVCCGAAAAVLGNASGLAALAGIALAAASCCAGSVMAGAAAGSATAGAASGWRLWLVWAVALMSALAAFGLYRLAARPGACPRRARASGAPSVTEDRQPRQ